MNPAKRVERGAAVLLSAVVLALASVVLLGWLFDLPRLRHFSQVWSAMAPLTAVLLLLLGCGIFFFERRPRLSGGFLGLAALLASVLLAEYLLDLRLGLAGLSGLIAFASGVTPELPAPDTSAAALFLVLSMLALGTTNRYLHDTADVIASAIGIICLQVLIEYAYNLAGSDAVTGFRQVAPHSTFSMMLLSMAVIARRRTGGIAASMSGPEHSAIILRWLLPITLLLCLLCGYLLVLAVHANLGNTLPELVAWTITIIVVVLAILLFVTSGEMRHSEAMVRRRQEELMAATAAAEAASEAKSRFMAVMSHELRTPLTAVIGYADLLDAGLAGGLSPQAKTYMQRIRESSWHLVGMIDAVLFYAGGRLPAHQNMNARVDVGEVIREVISTFSRQAREKNLKLDAVLPPQPVIVITDHAKLRQILLNLLSNAVKFTREGGILVALNAAAERVTIEVSDSGPGIDAAHVNNIWEPFQLIDDSHTRTTGGMGLGLALTHRLAEQLGVEIAVTSEVGKGTAFTVTLQQSAQQPATQIELKGTRVLVVDDESPVRRIMARTLARYGSDVQEAESAYEALEKSRTGIDVLVTDISMPGMSGIELVHALRLGGNRTPVVFVTGAHLDDKDQAEVDGYGGQLLRKPFDMVELARVVQRLKATF